jgi:hypothetical protein
MTQRSGGSLWNMQTDKINPERQRTAILPAAGAVSRWV